MKAYQTKAKKLAGSNYKRTYKNATKAFNVIKKKTKRQSHIRSTYWKKEKVFLNYFWQHAMEKSPRDRMRRLKFFNCAIELMQKTHYKPIKSINNRKPTENLYKFAGITKEGELFFVQIKENKKTGKKYFMSCFPED